MSVTTAVIHPPHRAPTLEDVCNDGCGCTTAFPAPVCSDDVTYFSACYAGCKEVEKHTTGDNNIVSTTF